jgi:hypothetical protein
MRAHDRGSRDWNRMDRPVDRLLASKAWFVLASLLAAGCSTRVTDGAGAAEQGTGASDESATLTDGSESADPTESGGASGDEGTGGKTDSGTVLPEPDVGHGEPPPPACLDCTVELQAQLAGGFELIGGDIDTVVVFEGVPVYVTGRFGAGRFIAAADSSFVFREGGDCSLHAWLAGHDGSPEVLWFGWTGEEHTLPPLDVTTVGVHLPEEYVGRPDLLAAEFDIVLYSEASFIYAQQDQPLDAELQTVLDYVAEYGGGVYVASEYSKPGSGYLGPLDLWSVNRLLEPLGVGARGYDLGSGPAWAEACFESP